MGILTIHYEQTKGDASGTFSAGLSTKKSIKAIIRIAAILLVGVFLEITILSMLPADSIGTTIGVTVVLLIVLILCSRHVWHQRADMGWGQSGGVAQIPQANEKQMVAELRDMERGAGVTIQR